MSVSTISTAPFATGLGNEHPIENGFAFLTPYGLPYLAGSGVKGILRRSMQELHKDGEEGFTDEATNTLFGPEKIDKPEDAQRGALDFWDVFPNPAGDKMVVEIMTPHFGKYYRREDTPHDSGAPVPVSFLAVPAGSAFDFHVVCQSSRLSDALQATWKDLLDRAFRHAFEWVGFGAKTSVGYGAMKEDPSTVKLREAQKQKALADAEAAERALRISSMSPLDQFIENEMAARQDKNQSKLAFFFNKMKQQTAVPGEFRLDIAKMLQMLMKDAKKWKEKSEKKNPEKDGDFQDTLKVKAWLTSK
jgi:CRISPR-associated protein Cmr6